MQYVLFMHQDPEGEPYTAENDTTREWVKEMDAAGRQQSGNRLRPASEGILVRVRRGQTLVADGPFAETKEWINGFDIIECANREQAAAAAARHPAARFGSIEVREVWPLFEKGSN